MSGLSRRNHAPQRGTGPSAPDVHAIVVDVDTDGGTQVTVDGVRDDSAAALRRPQVLSHVVALAHQLGSPCQVLIREADGRCFTDLLDPSRLAAEPEPEEPQQPVREEPAGALTRPDEGPFFVLTADGFFSGERVDVLLLASGVTADPDGCVVVRVPWRRAPQGPASVALRGRISWTLRAFRGDEQ